MTRGNPLEDWGIRHATPFAPPSAQHHGLDVSRILVFGLIGIFLLSSFGFIAAALSAKPGIAPPRPTPGPAGALPAAGALAAPGSTLDPSATLDPNATVGPATSGRSPSCPTSSPGATTPAPDTTLTPDATLPPDAPPAASPPPTAGPDGSPIADPCAVDPPDPSDPPASPLPTSDPKLTDARMPFVPVVSFWSTRTTISRADLVADLKGGHKGFRKVIVPARDRAAIAGALGIHIADSVATGDPRQIIAAVKKGALGLLRATDVDVAVRAIGIDGKELFGNDRVKSLEAWPLKATVKAASRSAWDQRKTWTLVAGGDSFTDRGIYERVINRHKGLDYPFGGGNIRATGHVCCGPHVQGFPDYEVPTYRKLGGSGIVRDLLRNADLAMANHESPIPRNWVFHLHSTTFSSSPALTEIFTRAGIDWLSLANNHIKDFGTSGVIDTRKALDRFGIKYGGAGRDLDQARKVSYLGVKGQRIGMIGCVAVAPFSWASRSGGGAMPCLDKYVLPAIAQARKKADIVIVFAHWGVEYNHHPMKSQRQSAAKWAKAGATLVLGAHSHVAGAIGQFGDTPVLYSLGNFIFDQNFRTETMESVLAELTWQGDRLVQMRLHPFMTIDQAQPNLLDPTTDDGKAVLKAIRSASSKYIDW